MNRLLLLNLFFSISLFSCNFENSVKNTLDEPSSILVLHNKNPKTLSEAAISITKDKVVYDPTYFSIDYPNGDIPKNKGVCTDVVIRAFRKIGIDLQKEVHEDMKIHFNLYPKKWGLKTTDKNIDHRRVPNLRVFFKRKEQSLTITKNRKNYLPGDIVTWVFDNGLTHIGIVVDNLSNDNKRHLIVHNIGNGQVMEDVLFDYTITGHYRY